MNVTRRETWALIAVKRFDLAKSRLAPRLDRAARAAFAEAMLQDVMTAVSASRALDGALVVTSDPAAAAVARRFGAATVDDAFQVGVNCAIHQGLKHLECLKAARAIVVPGDVPLLTGDEVDEVVAALEVAPVALTPAERDGGTNLLALSPLNAIAPAFGPNSLDRHIGAVLAVGATPRIVRLVGAGLDIDVPEDLGRLAQRDTGTRAGAFLLDLAAKDMPPQTRPCFGRIVQL